MINGTLEGQIVYTSNNLINGKMYVEVILAPGICANVALQGFQLLLHPSQWAIMYSQCWLLQVPISVWEEALAPTGELRRRSVTAFYH